MTKFLIVDGNSLGCRAAFAAPKHSKDLCTKENIPTGTIVRFINMLNKVMCDIVKPTHIVVAWDTDANTFRKQLYPEYKANRQAHKEQNDIDMHIVHKQFKMLRNMLEWLGIKNVNIQGFEGDDICGSFATISKADENYIVTGDKDSFQLVNDNTYIVYPKSGFTDVDIVNEQYINDKFNVSLDNYIGLKTLQGDASDNIHGFTGCGPKTAAKLLDEFGNSDIIARLKEEELSNYNKKIKTGLADWQSRYELLKTLVTIRTDVELPYTFDDCEIDLLKWDELIPYMEQLEMNNFINRIKWGAVYRLHY